MHKLLIGIVDTGINPWHSHVRGNVQGCRLYVDCDGTICEDDDFSDLIGHGTAVAGVLRNALPGAGFFAVRIFEKELTTYPSLLARGVLRAAAEGCDVINLSLALPPDFGVGIVTEACIAAQEAGSVLVAAGHPDKPGLLPASLPGVYGVISDDALEDDEIELHGATPYRCRARGIPRELDNIPASLNLKGHSLACARVTAYIAQTQCSASLCQTFERAG
jgi:subtilisin family serine protease